MSANQKLNRYLGRLSSAQIAQGINCANANAKRLLADAELLCQNGRYPSAVGMAILAIEEAGKEPVLRTVALARNAEELKTSWKDYRTHTEKNRLLAVLNITASGANKLEDYKPLFFGHEYPQLIENLKQVSFYTDCLEKAHWSTPTEVIDEKMAKQIVVCAKLIIDAKHVVAEKEIELLLKHLRPVWKIDFKLMKAAMKDYLIEMLRLGLIEGSAEDVISFVDGKKDRVH